MVQGVNKLEFTLKREQIWKQTKNLFPGGFRSIYPPITLFFIFIEWTMESLMKLPDDMFSRELLQYLTVHDIVRLDNACMNYKYRFQLLDKVRDVILIGDEDKSMKTSLFKWLGMRRIYLIKMSLYFKDNCFFSSSIEHDYVDQFRYTQHVVMRGIIRDVMAIFIISHCPCLVSIVISGEYYGNQTTDHTLQKKA